MNSNIGDLVPESIEDLRLLRPKAVALILDISERYVDLLAQRGEIRCFRFGRSLRFSPAQVAAYLSASSKGASENEALEAGNQDISAAQ